MAISRVTSNKADDSGVFAVRRFVEKPSKDVAEGYVESGRFFWNAGIFLFSADVMLRLFETNAPEILSACRRALDGAVEDLNFLVLGDQYSRSPSHFPRLRHRREGRHYRVRSPQHGVE